MNTSRILVIGDLHLPFTHKDYFDHCRAVAKHYKTTHTILMGDLVDNHFASYHETDPDGYSGGDELMYSIKELRHWHKAFPNADVVIGNHDRIIARKLKTAGISRSWARSLEEVLQVPTWTFDMHFNYEGVHFVHGEGVTARTKAQRIRKSVVQGHRHTEAYAWLHSAESYFGMQVGCGIDNDSFAFAYAKDHPAPVLACGVVLDNGRVPIVLPMYEKPKKRKK